MAQNMETQRQTVKALIRLILGLGCLPEKSDMGLYCLPGPELLKKGS